MDEPKKRRRIEGEFGVPIAGDILDPSLDGMSTALKKLPDEGPLHLAGLFGRLVPLVVDLGCGNGRWLIGSAWSGGRTSITSVWTISPLVIRYATRCANQRGLKNIRFAVVDADRLLTHYLPPGSAAKIHCYHPQPFYDPSQAHRRLITPQVPCRCTVLEQYVV